MWIDLTMIVIGGFVKKERETPILGHLLTAFCAKL
jgi:hypothetical protein